MTRIAARASGSAAEAEEAVRAALRKRRLRAHYQPVIDLRTGAVVSVEALLRIGDPARGLSAAAAIAAAEDAGLIHALFEALLERACADMHGLSSVAPGLRFSVNVSPRQIERGDLVTAVRQVLRGAGVSPRRLELEIAGRRSIDLRGPAARTIGSLQAMGVRVGLDEVGDDATTVLDAAADAPIDFLKITMPAPGKQPASGQVPPAVHSPPPTAGRSPVWVAKLIEDDRTRRFAVAYGYPLGQGLWLAPPLPTLELARWLEAAAPGARQPAVIMPKPSRRVRPPV